MIARYADRQHAGKVLANQLQAYAADKKVIVLALPRGGVPVAYEVAKAIHAPLDVFIVRKLGMPHHPELAMGAIAMGGACVYNHELIKEMHVSPDAIKRVMAEEQKELQRRELAYRGHRVFPDLLDKTVILVDDGIATGASMRAAIMALHQLNPKKLVVAVPVADQGIAREIDAMVNEFICPLQVDYLSAVGAWYESFPQTEDSEVHSLLAMANS